MTQDQPGRPAVGFALDDADGERMRALTGPNVGNSMAIVLDGEVLSPRLMSRIAGRGQIPGNFSEEEVRQFVGRLQVELVAEDAK